MSAAEPPAPQVPGPVRAVVEGAFAAAARLRGARPFHPRGMSFAATLSPLPDQPLALLGDGPRDALVRCSRSAGLPPPFPDVFGLGIRIPGGAGPGRPQDLLLATAGEAPGLRHLLLPARGFSTRRYSSLLLYRHAGALRLLGARFDGPQARGRLDLPTLEEAAAASALRFTLAIAEPTGPWQPVAELLLHNRIPAEASRRLRFHPWNTAEELRPVGPLNHLRAPAYDASQRNATSE